MKLLAAILALSLLTGCAGLIAAKKTKNYIWTGCKITKRYTDQAGNEREDCSCLNGKKIGVDAKTKADIIRCQ